MRDEANQNAHDGRPVRGWDNLESMFVLLEKHDSKPWKEREKMFRTLLFVSMIRKK